MEKVLAVKEINVGMGISLEVRGVWYRPNAGITIEVKGTFTKEEREKAFRQAFDECVNAIEKQIEELK